MKKTLFSAFLMFIFGLTCFVISCSKTVKKTTTQNPDATVGQMNGKIILPSGVSFNANSLTVHSPVGSAKVQNTSFSIKAFVNTPNTTIVMYENGGVAMMGYYFPESKDSTITIESTALALVMNTPAAIHLTSDGKRTLMAKIQSEASFSELAEMVKANLLTSHDLFDSTNTALFEKIGQVIEIAKFKTTADASDPISFSQSGRDLLFKNDGNIKYSTAVGIYKDGSRIEHFIVSGVNLLPASLYDVVNRIGTNKPPSVEKKYTMTGDGEFEIHIRSGRIGADDGTQEYDEALLENLKTLILDDMIAYIPGINTVSETCWGSLVSEVYNVVKSVKGITWRTALLYAFDWTYDNITDVVKCMGKDFAKDLDQPFFSAIKRMRKALNEVFLVSDLTNMTLFVNQWYSRTPSFDTCYKVKGNDVTKCDDYKIGDHALGGIIGYILQPADPGYEKGKQHGLVITIDDLTDLTGASEWGCDNIFVGGTSKAFGTGAANTAKISSSPCGSGSAARLCADLVRGGYDDWYLPSIDELIKINDNNSISKVFIPYFGYYWSSSESSYYGVWLLDYYSGGGIDGVKGGSEGVRGVRSF